VVRSATAIRSSDGKQEVTLAVGVSTVRDGTAAVGAAYREASLALRRVAATGGGVLSLPDMRAFEYLERSGSQFV